MMMNAVYKYMCCVVLLLLLIIIFYKVHINPQFGSVNFISEQHLIPGNRVTFANGRFHIHTQHTHIQGFLWDSQQLDGVPSSLVTFTYSLNGCCLLCVAYCRVYAICFAVFFVVVVWHRINRHIVLRKNARQMYIQSTVA